MITGFGGATIWSSDLNNLLPFYRDTLGLPDGGGMEGFVLLGDPTAGPTLALGTHSDVNGKNSDPARHMVSVTTDDIAAEVQRLKSKGVEFVSEPETFENVQVATFKDPENNYVQLLQFG
jgi:predicted enzyme related to lactoylglutathione lyase